ncbi:hypothetical protein LDENG_00168870 [Lucifuga dentata]|nr:hypothetical protein LDENG_00168870 [Lucifuga dentata]
MLSMQFTFNTLKHAKMLTWTFKGPSHPFCMFEPNIFNFHTCYVTDNISQRIKLYFSFPDILLNLLIFQNQIFK